MAKYLIELGTEELPYSFIPSAMKQLKDSFTKELKENRIEFGAVKTYGTPRRLTVIIEDIAESQPDLAKEVKGPPAKIAFDESGNLTQAGKGFLKKQGINEDAAYKQDINGTDYLYARVEEKGQQVSDVLATIVPTVFLKLQGSHFMRWGELEVKFSRPIRWIVSLLDNKPVPLEIANVKSSNVSRGHRFYKEKNIEITNVDSYFDTLYEAKVIVDQDKRLEKVKQQAQEAAKSIDGVVELDPELLKEVTYILEWPVPVIGEFETKYLEIPEDVIVTVMASHQRYFPIYDNNGKLINKFITMANYIGDEFANIKAGNERVIRARLDDAIFFYKEDNKKTLESRIEDLKGVTFQKGLGSMYDKVNRIKELSISLAKELNLNDQEINNVQRTADLCKADLVTNLVFEFTELQGFIGADYAKLHGDNTQVAQGIKEHYFPLSSDADLAESTTGQIVGIADKIDTICGVFSTGKIPTGSADPLGIRRAVLGTLLTIINKGLKVNLSELIEKSISLLPIEITDKVELKESIREFICQRLKIYLNDTYKHDVIDAALSAKDPLADLTDLVNRVKVLTNLVSKDNYSSFHEAANRISRIIKTDEFKSSPDGNLFVQDVERQLWDCIVDINSSQLDYEKLIAKLEAATPIIEKFFDDVLVMDKDENIKENRISLLGNLKVKFFEIGDFSKIVA